MEQSGRDRNRVRSPAAEQGLGVPNREKRSILKWHADSMLLLQNMPVLLRLFECLFDGEDGYSPVRALLLQPVASKRYRL